MISSLSSALTMSHPSRVCGLKYLDIILELRTDDVTPLAGVWIEILRNSLSIVSVPTVTPLAGVWIEIISMRIYDHLSFVTPLAGVWIEISTTGS